MIYRVTLRVDQMVPGRRVSSNTATEDKAQSEVLVVVSAPNVDVALSKAIGLAKAEQADRDARALMPGEQNQRRPYAHLEEDDEVEG